jgi:quinol monooxygenase YgiN
MEIHIFARFHARAGNETAIAEALAEVLAPTHDEPGCLGIQAFRSIRDSQLFYIHSRWINEEAFEREP